MDEKAELSINIELKLEFTSCVYYPNNTLPLRYKCSTIDSPKHCQEIDQYLSRRVRESVCITEYEQTLVKDQSFGPVCSDTLVIITLFVMSDG